MTAIEFALGIVQILALCVLALWLYRVFDNHGMASLSRKSHQTIGSRSPITISHLLLVLIGAGLLLAVRFYDARSHAAELPREHRSHTAASPDTEEAPVDDKKLCKAAQTIFQDIHHGHPPASSPGIEVESVYEQLHYRYLEDGSVEVVSKLTVTGSAGNLAGGTGDLFVEIGMHPPTEKPVEGVYRWSPKEDDTEVWTDVNPEGSQWRTLRFTSGQAEDGEWSIPRPSESVSDPEETSDSLGPGTDEKFFVSHVQISVPSNASFSYRIAFKSMSVKVMGPLLAWYATPQDFGRQDHLDRYVVNVAWDAPIPASSLRYFDIDDMENGVLHDYDPIRADDLVKAGTLEWAADGHSFTFKAPPLTGNGAMLFYNRPQAP